MALYRSPHDLAVAAAERIKGSLADSAIVLVAGTPQYLDRLNSEIDLARSGIEQIDLRSFLNPGRLLWAIRAFASKHLARPLTCLQEVGWLDRPYEELAEAIRYERLLSLALAGRAAEVTCWYDARISEQLLGAAERAHSAGQPGHPSASELGWPPLSPAPQAAEELAFRGNQAEVREFAGTLARQAGLPPDRIADLIIVVGELAGNTLRHTASAGTLTAWSSPDEFICQVSDAGHIADPLAGTLRPDAAEIGKGRGLWLVHQVGDLVQTRTGPRGTTTRVHMRLPVRTDPPPRLTSESGLQAGANLSK